MNFDKQLFKKVAQGISHFRMIEEGDRIAVGISGGKDSLTMLDALLHIQKKSPIAFELRAFTIEQGKFLMPVQPLEQFMNARGVQWTLVEDRPSLRLIEDQVPHGCDLCSRYRRRAVYEVARTLKCNVIALGHTADDFAEALIRNILFTGEISSLPAAARSSGGEFRLIRPLVFVHEEVTTAYAAEHSFPIVPCECSVSDDTARKLVRGFLHQMGNKNPKIWGNITTALQNINHNKLLDQRYSNLIPSLGNDTEALL